MSYRRLFAAFAACTFAVAPASVLAQKFEGTVTYAINPASPTPGELVYYVKGTRIRAELSRTHGALPGGAYILLDAASGTMMSVMPAQKMYLTMDMKAISEKMKQRAAHKPKRAGTITKTGKRETIAGYKCEHYVMGEAQDSDVCAAKGLGMFMGGVGGLARGGAMFGGLPAGYEEYAEFAKEGFLPLKVSTIRNGKPEVVLEAKSVQRKALDASLFAVPAGYQEMDMGKMMGQMQRQKQPGR
jgi:hypothetical protein